MPYAWHPFCLSIAVMTFSRKIGAWYTPATSEFTVWAPDKDKVELVLESPVSKIYPMEKDEQEYWTFTAPSLPAGARYRFRLDGQDSFPDPASFSQPDGVHAASELALRLNFAWTDAGWHGLPLSNMIIYELHTGCFSTMHNFDGIIERLDYLAELGINTVELMPLGQFSGDRNWGYDGVYPFAIQNSYGGITGFQHLVDAAHAKGIAILVDVIYNHIGPEGGYLDKYAPYHTDKYRTPWGSSLNFDSAWSDGVRNYFLQNARMWLEDYHADGLRLDAVHAIRDFSANHFIQQLKEEVTQIERRTGRQKVLIAELDLNDPRYIDPPEKGGYGLDGQWIDEFHHALRTLLTGEKNAYYEDFGEIQHVEKAFRQTYVYNGTYSVHRKRTFGGKADNHPYSQFVVFAQNHDQVGNRARGDRLTHHLSLEQLKLMAAAVLLSPYVPLLFMGEEYGERNPFPFFVSFSDPALIESVRKGRAAEFPGFTIDAHPGATHPTDAAHPTLPDPESVDTFNSAVLSFDHHTGQGAILWNYYRHLIALRKTRPALQGRTRDSMIVHPPVGQVLLLERRIMNDDLLILLYFDHRPTIWENNTGHWLTLVFDTSGPVTPGPTTSTLRIAPGNSIGLSPFDVLIFEKPYS